MRVEAWDRKTPSLVCVATIGNYIMLHTIVTTTLLQYLLTLSNNIRM